MRTLGHTAREADHKNREGVWGVALWVRHWAARFSFSVNFPMTLSKQLNFFGPVCPYSRKVSVTYS